MGGLVKQVYVKEGDFVRKGQLLIKLDDALMLQNLKQLETQLAFAQNIYTRQKNLWDQQIGTEVQYLTAKNNVENIEKQIASLKEQWNTSNVYSEVSGIVETVSIHPGETFSGMPTATITIVNQGSLKAVVDVPENYLEKVKKGTPVLIEIPDINRKFNSNISLVSQLINANSRGFMAEAKIPASANLKPNQIALVKIQDYSKPNAMVIPMTTLQTDEKGKYVFVLEMENGKKIARKKQVNIGEVYGDQIEVLAGLKEGDQLISQGFQSLYDGQLVTTDVN
jgi:membrane fusion protein, multidrug efflux system